MPIKRREVEERSEAWVDGNNSSQSALRFCLDLVLESALATYIPSLLLEHEELVYAFLNLAILHATERRVSWCPCGTHVGTGGGTNLC